MLYVILKRMLRPALRVFFEQTDVEGREHLPETGPLVVVANHPNTLMDPLLVGMLWRRQLHFLTSSRFFVSVGNWVLRASGAIPLYRQEDHAAASAEGAARLTGNQRAARNDESFRATFDLLAAGGALLIFPEGSSVLTRRLRPFKSGAARIALGAEARHGWQLGVQLVPVGLHYAEANRFRSRLFRRVGAPLRADAYRASYEANPAAAIRALTEDLRRALEAQLLAPRTAADDQLLLTLEPFVQPALCATLLPERAGHSPSRQEFALTRALLHAVQALDARDPVRGQALRQRLTAYHGTRHRLGLGPAVLLDAAPPPGRGLALLLGAPVWGWGVLHHYPAYALSTYLARRATTEVEFVASITMVVGMLSIPLSYAGQTWLVWHLTHSAALAAAYLGSLPLAGAFALAYQRWLAAWRGQGRVARLARRHGRLLANLRAQHAHLLADLKQAHADWRQAAPAGQ